MTKKCCLLSCKRGPMPGRTLFRFPLDRTKRLAWFDAVSPDLPDDLTVDCLNNKYICDAHFPSIMYATSGNRKRLFCNACPTKITQQFVRTPVKIPENVIQDINKKSVATQVHFAANEREIISLKKKINQLVSRLEKLKSDPPTSLIYKHRHKLANYVSDEAWLLFDCAVQNQQKTTHGYRHTMEVKKWTQSIAQKNRMAFKMLKPIFSLPSLRTLGRMEAESANTTTTTDPNNTFSTTDNNNTFSTTTTTTTTTITTINNTSNSMVNNNSVTNDNDKSINTSLSTDNLQMDQTSELENINIEDLHLGNITFVSVPYTL